MPSTKIGFQFFPQKPLVLLAVVSERGVIDGSFGLESCGGKMPSFLFAVPSEGTAYCISEVPQLLARVYL